MENLSEEAFLNLRQKMVTEQIIERGIRDERVVDALLQVKRHHFLPLHKRSHAYADCAVPIGFGQTISQPYIVAYMLERLALTPGDKVLEVGSGSGYVLAILETMGVECYGIELIPELAERAIRELTPLGFEKDRLRLGDGYEGWAAHAPYTAIIISAAPQELPRELVRELAIGGRMVLPFGEEKQELVQIVKTEEGLESDLCGKVKFVPLVKKAS